MSRPTTFSVKCGERKPIRGLCHFTIGSALETDGKLFVFLKDKVINVKPDALKNVDGTDFDLHRFCVEVERDAFQRHVDALLV